MQSPDTPGRWILSSDPQTVKDFAAAHFQGLQSAHEWNRDPDEYPLVFDLILLITADGQVVWCCLSNVKAAFSSVLGFAWNCAYARLRLPSWIRGCFNFNESGCACGSAQRTITHPCMTCLRLAPLRARPTHRPSSSVTSMSCSAFLRTRAVFTGCRSLFQMGGIA